MIEKRSASMRRGRVLAAPTLALLFLAGCADSPDSPSPRSSAGPELSVANTHVHAIERNGPNGNVLLATHDGLWSADGNKLSQVGPLIDLMSFSVLDAGTYRASGHPRAGLGLAEPAGLIETRDAGQTWSVLSRGGESDFHLLEANNDVTVGFDGVVRSSTDGTSWQDQPPPDGLVDLALQPAGQDLLATASEGLLVSTDLGAHWELVPAAPPLVLLDWVDTTTVIGISNEGGVYVSIDAGSTWQERNQLDSAIQAMSANRTPEGGIELLVAEEADFRAVLIS